MLACYPHFTRLTAKLFFTVSAFLTLTGPVLAQLSFDRSTAVIGAAGGSGSVELRSIDPAAAWQLITEQDWFTIASARSGAGSGVISYSVAANPTARPRTATLTLTPASGGAQSLTVTQSGATLSLSLTSANQRAGATGSFTVRTDSDALHWTAVSRSAWLSVTSGSSGVGTGTVQWSVAAGGAPPGQTGIITVTPLFGIGKTFTVTPSLSATPELSVSPSSVNVDTAGGSGSLQVQSNETWEATSDQTWLTITSGSPGQNNGPIGYSAAANPNAARMATITVNPRNGPRVFVPVSQSGGTLVVSPSSANAPPAGGSGSVSVTSNSSTLTWTITSSVPWLTFAGGSPRTGTVPMLQWTAIANTLATGRSATLTITPSGGTAQTVRIDQAAGNPGTISVNPTSISAPASVSNNVVQVTTTAPTLTWTASSNQPWLTITSGSSGTGNGAIEYAAAGNPTASTRTATITVSAPNVPSATTTVTQAATTASINPTSASAPGAGSTSSFSFTTNNSTLTWTAASNQPWLTLRSAASGTGDLTMAWAAEANTSTTPRTGTITVTPSAGSPLPFTVTQQGLSGTITVNPASLAFSYQLLGTPPPNAQINLNSLEGALPFTAAAATVTGGSWLTVSGNNTQTPAALTASVVNFASLAAGVYQGTVTITSAAATNSPITIPVTLTVTPAPVLTALPNALTFSFQQGGRPPELQTIALTTGGTPPASLDYSILPDPDTPWLTATGPGPAPSTLSVSVNPVGLAPGAYLGTITLIAPSAGNNPLTIPVSLRVSAAPSLVALPSSLSLTYRQLDPVPAPISFAVTSSGADLSFSTSVSSSTPWLTVSEISPILTGQTPSGVQLSINPTGLSPGDYQGSVILTSEAAGNSPLSVPVSLTVQPGPVLTALPHQLNFGLTMGGPTSAIGLLAISSDSLSPIGFTAAAQTTSGGNWLAAESSGTQTPSNLTVSISAAGLAPGTYAGTIVLTSAQVTNSPLPIPVRLTISVQPQLIVLPMQLTFEHQLLNGVPPAPAFLTVNTSDLLPANITPTTAGGTWLSTGVGFATPGSLRVSVDPTGLLVGTHTGTVTLTSPGYATATVPVTLRIVSAPVLSTQPTSLSISYQQGGSIPLPEAVNVASSSTPLSFSVTGSGGSWLIVTGGATTPAQFSVSVNPVGLAAGTYTGSVSVTSQMAGNSPLSVPVTLLVTAAPVISTNPVSLSFTYTVDSPSLPAAQTLSFSSTEPLPFSTSISPGESWLVVTGQDSARSVSVNPSGLLPGQYNSLITVSAPGAGNGPQHVPVLLTVLAAPLLSPSPSQFTFSYQTQGPLPANQVLTIDSSDDSVLVATATAASGGDWLSVTGGGNTPTTFSLIANPTGLAPGTYQGSITVSAPNAGNSPLSIPVTLVVSSAPVITAAPGQLSFSYQIGTPAPATASVQVTSSGNALLFQVDATTDSGGAWLQVSGGGTTPLTVTANVSPAGLAPGIYTATISLSSAGAGNSPLLVPVTLTITTTSVLTASPASIQFTVQQNAPAPPAQVVRVQAGAAQIPVTYSGSPNAPWLTFTGSPTTPGDLSLTVSPAGLAPGRYTAVVLVRSDFAANSPLEIPVTLDVSATPVLSAVPAILRYTFDRLGSRPPAQTLSIVSSGAPADFNVSVVPGPAWLFASGSGNTPSTISVTVDPGILAPGEYQGTVLVSRAGAGTPVQVQVILTVTDAPVLATQPSALNFVYQTGGVLPSAQSVTVSSNRGSLPTSVAVQTFSGGAGWLAVNGGGRTPTTASVTVNPAGLTPGTYTGQIAFTATGAGNSPILVPVTLTVTAAAAITASPTALTFATQLNGAAPANRLIVLNSTDGSPLPIGSVLVSGGGSWLTVNSNSTTTPATLTASVTPAGLSVGTYQASIVISSPAAQNSPIIVPIVLVIAAQPSLTASAAAAAFASGVGGSAPQQIQIVIGSTGAPLAFTSSVAPGAGWLSVTGSGTTPSSIQVGVNPAGLAAGRYGGTIAVTSAAAANNPLLLPIDLIVSSLPLLSAAPGSLVFSTGPSGSAPPQTVRVTSSGAAPSVTASISAATPWLSVSGGGPSPLDLIVSVNTAGLAPGTYQGAVQVLAPGAGNSPLSIPVTLVISAALLLQASPSPVNFTHQANDSSLEMQTVSVGLGGQPATGARSAVTPGSPWLSALASGGEINVVADPAGLAPGTYNGTVTVTADGAANSPLIVPVILTLIGFPVFDISHDALAFAAVREQSQPISTVVTLGRSGQPPFNFELTVTASTWLSVTPLAGTTPADVTVTVDPTGLRSGSYSGSVVVSSSGNRLRTILVNLVVADAPALGTSPPFLQFSYLNGGDLPSPVNLWVGRFGADVIVTATPTEPWLSVDPSGPTTSGPIKVTASPSGLSTGTHVASIVLTATGASGTPVAIKRVPVTLYVNRPANPKIFGVLNGMSFLDTPLVPGLIFSIFGTGLGPAIPGGPGFQEDGTLSQSVAGVEVLVNGIPCPLLYVSATQINAIAPYALFNRTSAQVAVRFLGILSDEVPVNVSPSLPGVFAVPPTGAGPGVILNQDLTVNTSTNPAARQSIVAIYAGGGGQTTPQGLDGSINGPVPLPNLLLPVSVTIGGIPAPDITYAGAAPGFPDGSLQINVRIPDAVPSGNVPVVVKIGDATSQGALTVNIR